MDLDTLLALAEAQAVHREDGHLTLLRFTTGWKCMFGTPELSLVDNREISGLKTHSTLKGALLDLLTTR
jgi:hypothetical protein